jgi:hypothetical protein
MDLAEIGWGGVDSIDVAQNKDKLRTLVNEILKFRVH